MNSLTDKNVKELKSRAKYWNEVLMRERIEDKDRIFERELDEIIGTIGPRKIMAMLTDYINERIENE